jgi:hypothetical protein
LSRRAIQKEVSAKYATERAEKLEVLVEIS